MMQDGTPSADARHRSPERNWIDPAAIMRIKNLQLRAKTIVEGFFNGLHRSPFHGFSAEFSEYRQYTAGDDTKYVDWRLFARSDRYYIKRFEEETNRRCYLVCDISRSMQYGSTGFPKVEYARTLAATFAYFLTRQRDSVGLLTFHAQVESFVPARHRHGHLRSLLAELEREPTGQGTEIAGALEQVAALVRKRGLVVLISDLLAPAEQLERPLAYLRSRGHEVFLVRVLDPAEVEFPFERAAMFRDVESAGQLFVNPISAKREYLDRLHRHREQLREICQRWGVGWHELLTTTPLDLALSVWLSQQVRRAGGARITRRNPGATPLGGGGP